MKVVKGAPTREIYFTDDGFAMGIAYCLAILKQTKKNDALHWQDTIMSKLAADAKIVNDQLQERQAKENKLKEVQKKRSSFLGGVFGGKSKATQVCHCSVLYLFGYVYLFLFVYL